MEGLKEKYRELTGEELGEGEIVALDNDRDRDAITGLRKYLKERLGKEDIQQESELESMVDVRKRNGYIDEIFMEKTAKKTYFYTKGENEQIDVDEVYEHITNPADAPKKLKEVGEHIPSSKAKTDKEYNLNDYSLNKIYYSNGDILLKLKIKNKNSLHMRPAGFIDEEVKKYIKKYGREAWLTWNGKEFAPATMLGIMLSNSQKKAKKDEVLIKIQGNDVEADRMALKIYDIFKNKFYEN